MIQSNTYVYCKEGMLFGMENIKRLDIPSNYKNTNTFFIPTHEIAIFASHESVPRKSIQYRKYFI